jgi:hypothetical protein
LSVTGVVADRLVADLLQNTSKAARSLTEAQAERPVGHDLDDGEPDDDVQLTAWHVTDDAPAERDIAAWRAACWPTTYRGTGDDRLDRPPLARAGEDFRAATREQNQQRTDEAAEAITAILDAVGSRRETHWIRERGSLPFIGVRPPYMSKMIDGMLGGDSLWNDMSGVVHNKEDDGWRIMLGLTLGIENPHKGQNLALHSLGAVIGIVTLTAVIEAYTEWDLVARDSKRCPSRVPAGGPMGCPAPSRRELTLIPKSRSARAGSARWCLGSDRAE